MIFELIEFCLPPASFESRKNGYLYEAIAFESRAKRNRLQWDSHWNECHKLTLSFLNEHSEASSLTIFGSGCLFEIPKALLVQRLQRITLVDQVFPRSVRSWTKSQKIEIEFMECDLTKNFPLDLQNDLSISANIFSQLSIFKPKQRQENEQRHLHHLQALGKPTLLWSDFEKVYLHSQTGEVLHRQKTADTPLDLKEIGKWDWNLALSPEWHENVDVVLRMKAFEF